MESFLQLEGLIGGQSGRWEYDVRKDLEKNVDSEFE